VTVIDGGHQPRHQWWSFPPTGLLDAIAVNPVTNQIYTGRPARRQFLRHDVPN